jgi:GT2 family glycosyltransferase
MNPDTIAFKDTFRLLFDFMEKHPDVGMSGPLQYNPDQTVQDSCFRWFGLFTPLYRRTPLGGVPFAQKDLARFLMKDFDRSYRQDVDWLMGSCLFCRAKALKKVGLFDDDFFMYFEDTDLCRRFWQKKWRVVYFPDAKIIHNHMRQSARDPWYRFFYNRSARQHVISWFKYVVKWGLN